MHILILLLVSHAVCDYPLQGDFLSKGKNHRNPIPGIPWYQCLLWHSVIHAGGVYLVTGSVTLFAAELILHAFIDFSKCEGVISFNEDQSAHVFCKIIWAVAAM